jgi:hypothetical protein
LIGSTIGIFLLCPFSPVIIEIEMLARTMLKKTGPKVMTTALVQVILGPKKENVNLPFSVQV